MNIATQPKFFLEKEGYKLMKFPPRTAGLAVVSTGFSSRVGEKLLFICLCQGFHLAQWWDPFALQNHIVCDSQKFFSFCDISIFIHSTSNFLEPKCEISVFLHPVSQQFLFILYLKILTSSHLHLPTQVQIPVTYDVSHTWPLWSLSALYLSNLKTTPSTETRWLFFECQSPHDVVYLEYGRHHGGKQHDRNSSPWYVVQEQGHLDKQVPPI